MTAQEEAAKHLRLNNICQGDKNVIPAILVGYPTEGGIMTNYRKPYQELTIADDFMFCKIMRDNPKLIKELLEMILDIPIAEIESVEVQHTIEESYNGHGVRLDIFLKDKMYRSYDIEMQTVYKRNLPKRSRYYTSMMDQESIDRGEKKYRTLTDSYVIFICNFNIDPTRRKYRYTFENLCVEDPTFALEDGTHKIFLCADGADEENISEDLKHFLHYIAGDAPENEYTKQLDTEVRSAKQHYRWRGEYMAWINYADEFREEGREQGREEGRLEGEHSLLLSQVEKKLQKNKSVEQIADELEISQKQAAELVEAVEKELAVV